MNSVCLILALFLFSTTVLQVKLEVIKRYCTVYQRCFKECNKTFLLPEAQKGPLCHCKIACSYLVVLMFFSAYLQCSSQESALLVHYNEGIDYLFKPYMHVYCIIQQIVIQIVPSIAVAVSVTVTLIFAPYMILMVFEDNDTVLFADDFENGLQTGKWPEAQSGHVVEDPTNSKNHALGFSRCK